ncbi:MAG: GTPase HflX [Candidatus Delongbacteria bacterium]|nr:GTPase HflX [Candidatus Delongbacteria bacterium]MBN2836267.1 GTPase HflX [Candidatus Delongbacteria bacterium]
MTENKFYDKAILVGACFDKEDYDRKMHSMDELERLADTAGIQTLAKLVQMRKVVDKATYLGKGFIEDVCSKMEMVGATIIIFDNELSPNQSRNLLNDYKVEAIDRTEVILEIFNRRAQTREARLQVKLATLNYQLPRLKKLWSHLDRESGSSATGTSGAGGVSRGMGEKQIEIDKRLIRAEIGQITKLLQQIGTQKDIQRKGRSEIKKVSLVGYTNAGKSTLFNKLTNAGVLVEDKLFATLDSTVRNFDTGINQKTVISDTVGFIADLPHHLVAGFRATLKEVVGADLLLHVVDLSDPQFEKNIDEVNKVLKSIEADNIPTLLVFNKIDACPVYVLEDDQLMEKYSDSVKISAANGVNIDEILKHVNFLIHDVERITLKIPVEEQELMMKLYNNGKVYNREFTDDYVILDIALKRSDIATLEHYLYKFECC